MNMFLYKPNYSFAFGDVFLLLVFFVLQFVAMYYWYRRCKRAEKGYNYFRSIMRSSEDAWVKISKSVKVGDESVYVSNKALKILNINREGAGSISLTVFLSLLDSSAVGVLESKITKLVSSGDEFELVITLSSKEKKHVRMRGVDLSSDCVIIWLRDVTSEVFERNYQSNEIVHLSNLKNKLLNVLNVLPIPVWIRGGDGKIQYCNTRYADLLDASYVSVIDNQSCLWGECVAVDGVVTPVNEGKYIVYDGDRHFLEFQEKECGGMLLGYAEDRTKEKRLEKQVIQQLNTNKELLQNLSVGIAVYDNTQRLEFYNKAYCKIFNLDDDFLSRGPLLSEVLDKLRSCQMLPEVADYKKFRDNAIEQFSTLDHTVQSFSHLPDGRSIRITRTPNLLGGVFFIFEDMTDKLDLERQFNTLVAVQRKTIDNLYEGIAVFAKDNTLSLCNSSFRKIWCVPDGVHIVGRGLSDLVEMIKDNLYYGADWGRYKSKIIRYSTDRNYKRKVIEKRDGSFVEFSYIPLPDGNHMISCQDVTSSYRIEKALREKNEALEWANKIKSDFISNVSSEMYKPVCDIHKNAFKVYCASRDAGRPAYYEYRVLKQSESLLNLVERVMELVKISSGGVVLEKTKVDVYVLVKGVVKKVRPMASSKKMDIKVECSKSIGSYFLDEEKVARVVFELLDNAVKFSHQRGRVVLSVRVEQKNLVFSVSDNGLGIKIKNQSKIFEQFSRTSESKLYSGVGIGLSLVKNIVDLHGGKIKLNSSTRKGTKIECSFPVEVAVVGGDNVIDASDKFVA